MERMWRRQTAIEGDAEEMALGWFVRRHRGTRMLAHEGRDAGVSSCIAFLPGKGVGVVLLANDDGLSDSGLLEVADGLLDIGLGREPALPPDS